MSFFQRETPRMSAQKRRKNVVPDRWMDYTAVGKRLNGTRFIAFKVPLKQSLNRGLPSSSVFGPWELLDTLQRQNQDLGLIIDLTFTTRYYSLQDVPESLLCVKIFTAGHEVPSDDTILTFKRTVHRFLQENQDNDKLIGVHCTHGLNRTGYLICRYLIDVDGLDPEEAVKLFNSSRGHPIERNNYLEDLKHGPKRSNKGMEMSEREPMRGQAVHRPTITDVRDREGGFNQPGLHRRTILLHEETSRSFPRGQYPRPTHHWSCHPPNRLLPYPLLPHPPPVLPLQTYPSESPLLDSRRRRSPHWEDGWTRPPQPEPLWGLAPPLLPHYSPHWTTTTNNGRAEEDWSRPRMMPPFLRTQRHTDP